MQWESWKEVNETLMLLRLCVGECRLCKKQLMKTEIKTARGMLMTLQGWYLICVNVCEPTGECVASLLRIVCESLVWAGASPPAAAPGPAHGGHANPFRTRTQALSINLVARP